MIKNVAGQSISAVLVSKSDGSPITSGTVTVYVTLAGGTQTAGAGTVEHEGNGQWTYFPTQAETNADSIAFLFTHTSAVPQSLQVYTTQFRVSATPVSTAVSASTVGLNRYQIREEVRRIIRDPDYPKQSIDRAINSVIAYLNTLGRFKFHQTHLDLTLVLSQKDYNLTGIIAEELLVYDPDTENEKIITKAPDLITPYSQGWFSETGDSPVHYVVWGNKVWFEPIPNSVAAGKTIRVYGAFKLALFSNDTTATSLSDQYCISVLAWGAAAEINPSLVIETSGKQQSINAVYRANLEAMLRTEAWEPMVSHNLIKDRRWAGLYVMGHVSRVR